MGGPIWNQRIHNIDFVKRLLEVARTNADKNYQGKKEVNLKTTERIQAILSAIIDEDMVTYPLSYDMSHIASTLKVQNPKKMQLYAAFRSLEYKLTQTYYDPKLYKTNAPP
jgi:tRNA G26 N,N-dimethylase Trm1